MLECAPVIKPAKDNSATEPDLVSCVGIDLCGLIMHFKGWQFIEM